MNYVPVIGLEIHAELATRSKLFCRCMNTSSELTTPPNSAICPVCLGLPGALPVLNKAAVASLVKLGLALACEVPVSTKWDRKHYFYPDLPKGYQISQYDEPICKGGKLTWQSQEGESQTVALTRIHLEEDTGKLTHPTDAEYSLIDYNRSSIPLIELVTEPEITSSENAKLCAQEYQHILRDLAISEASMEKGQMRCEANVSVVTKVDYAYPLERLSGTKVEIKNLNSFRSLERAIGYEIKRQSALLASGETVTQQTRGWNEGKQQTYVMREKETAEDYRYFPEPDLGRLNLSSFKEESGTIQLNRHDMQLKLQTAGADKKFITIVITDPKRLSYMTELLPIIDPNVYAVAARWVSQEPRIAEHSPKDVAEVLTQLKNGDLPSSLFKDALLSDETGSLKDRIISQLAAYDLDIEAIVKKVLESNPKEVDRYKHGQLQLLGYFVGQVRKALEGKGDARIITEELQRQLG